MFESLLAEMASCEQTKGLSVLQHGEMVRDYYQDLIGDQSRFEWRLPTWLPDCPRWNSPAIQQYHVFHDCGKPLCRTDDGRFPNHAEVSKRVWLEHGGSEEVAELIGMDMDIHLLKADGIAEFASRPQVPILLLTGLAEIHANSSLFGGLDSTSFKIKWKHIDKRGRQVLAHKKGLT